MIVNIFQKTWHLSPGDKVCNVLGVVDAPRKHLRQVRGKRAKLVRQGAPRTKMNYIFLLYRYKESVNNSKICQVRKLD